MKTYTVLYRDDSLTVLDEPYGFICEADNVYHAEEQCDNAYPDCDIVWVADTGDIIEALDEYYFVLSNCRYDGVDE